MLQRIWQLYVCDFAAHATDVARAAKWLWVGARRVIVFDRDSDAGGISWVACLARFEGVRARRGCAAVQIVTKHCKALVQVIGILVQSRLWPSLFHVLPSWPVFWRWTCFRMAFISLDISVCVWYILYSRRYSVFYIFCFLMAFAFIFLLTIPCILHIALLMARYQQSQSCWGIPAHLDLWYWRYAYFS